MVPKGDGLKTFLSMGDENYNGCNAEDDHTTHGGNSRGRSGQARYCLTQPPTDLVIRLMKGTCKEGLW